MLPFAQLGWVFLLAATVLSLLQIGIPLYGIVKQQARFAQAASNIAIANFALLLLSLLCLVAAFLSNDFSIAYIAGHSNSLMPWYYKVSAVWGGHEGSMLLWVTILGGWASAVALRAKALPLHLSARTLVVLATISLAFELYILCTSSPFSTALPILAVDGADLNPLLQDIGLIIHPPMLYMGYVGLAVPYAFVIAGLWLGRLDSSWAAWVKPWLLAAWAFLTVGIALGSWWAYYELGWGGWWFWDPVENASFMPWLAATVLLHSLAATLKRGVFKSWTALLAILAFSLCILGTFLVRSGVITSVHAFASDPSRGVFILAILFITTATGLGLYAWRGWQLFSETRSLTASRENLLAVNNILISTALLVVFLGTLYPLINDALGGAPISIGAPYYNALFRPLAWLMLLAMALAPIIQWRRTSEFNVSKLALHAGLALGTGGLCAWLAHAHVTGWLGLADIGITIGLCTWVLLGLTHFTLQKALNALPMVIAHIGLVVCLVGICLTSHLSTKQDVALRQGQSFISGPFVYTLQTISEQHASNYKSIQTQFNVHKGQHRYNITAEKRFYYQQPRPMTEAGIYATLLGDIYISAGEPLDAAHRDQLFNPASSTSQQAMHAEAWSFSIQYKAFVRLIWLGALIMALGAVMGIVKSRRSAP